MASSADDFAPDGVCLTCGRADCTIEAHHPAGAYNVPGITVPECTPGCHEVLTEQQWGAGIKLDRRLARSQAERSWALLLGVADVVALLARNRGLPEVATALEQGGPALGWVLSTLAPPEWSGRTGAAGDVGPDPRGNDRRQAVRERRGDSFPTATGESASDGTGETARAAALVELLAETGHWLSGDDRLASIDLPTLVRRLVELAKRGALDRLVEWGRRKAPEFARALAMLRSAAGSPAMGDALDATAWLAELCDAAIELLAGIASAEDADRAEALLAAFMEAWPPASPTAP